ncbi:N-acetylmuramoyl-L-alanine amidase family protein [Paenibacillus campi]|uniref:N-acetylmuramoyl-L-alanine amidase family protein n=1 Tax=Paenibacillus campi TaxID=3106031 RepID=UPI002AFE7E2B|nr:N-acetylmuramoyl-L-alanine amidase family protein [Paenibacillus sp. SGZ-1009]
MKKFGFLLFLFVCLWSFPHLGEAATSTKVVLNGQELSIPEDVQNMQGSVMVPIRVISENLGYKVQWNQSQGRVMIDGEGKSIQLFIGKKAASVGNKTYDLNTAPVVQKGTTLVPIRLVSEQMGIGVDWNNSDKIVTLSSTDTGTGTDTSTGGGTNSGSTTEDAENGLALVNGISFSESRLLVTLSKGVTPKVSKMDAPNRIVIDLPATDFSKAFIAQDQNTSVDGISSLNVVNNDNVSQVRYSQFSSDPSSIRLVIDLKNKQNYEVFTEGSLLIVDLVADNGKPAPTPPATPPTTGPTQPGTGVGTDGKKVIVIDAGHGDQDPGAIGSQTSEKRLNLGLALKVEALLKDDPSIDVVLTRSDDTFLPLKERVKIAEKLNADVFVSIHANSGSSSAASGTETYYQRTSSKKLAQTIHKYLVAATGFKDRGVQYGNFHVIRETTMPAVLLEVGFISNRAEESKMMDSAKQDQVAASIVKGIKEYLGVF